MIQLFGKRWGEKTGQPLIALHGFLDNLSTFDKLLPLLDVPSVLCLDLNGHGQSSHLPKGISIYYSDYLIQLRYLFKHLYVWDKDLVFMGHSFGSSLLFTYAALYPEEVSKMINIDCSRYRTAAVVKKMVKDTRRSMDTFLSTENHYKFSTFTFDECVNFVDKERKSFDLGINMESCKILVSRGTSNIGNGKYYFTHDSRLGAHAFGRNTASYNLALASRIKCQVLNVHASGGVNVNAFGLEEDKHIKMMNENCKSCLNLVLEGGHHIHLESPEVVAPHINKFLNS
ncbi:probable serine hydrolase isoform X1 [Rhodnius prolixus]|uniref:probable serine hydrolase isoform X1 n=1 Tax=Rhodnius prolixus TaxID=13249 RepID=UPI003D18CC7F